MKFLSQDFKIKDRHEQLPAKIEISASAPSNIALVKYWGKHGLQLPMNPSISFTLNKSRTHTKVQLTKLEQPTKKVLFKFYFGDKHQPDFEPKITGFFNNILEYTPFITDFQWKISSKNTFPHSSGIASSASGFATLAKIIIELEKQLYPQQSEEYYDKKASFLARLGSGSAARSTAHPMMIWGYHPQINNTSGLYAVLPDFELHTVFKNFRDSIVLVEKGQKKVSSTAGHKLMENHPFKEIRKQKAFDHTLQMIEYLKTGDLVNFIKLTEAEALSLHALMMTSEHSYILMQPDTLKIIHLIRNIRNNTGLPVCFTLDAGANVHILYPERILNELETKLFSKIKHEVIHDYV